MNQCAIAVVLTFFSFTLLVLTAEYAISRMKDESEADLQWRAIIVALICVFLLILAYEWSNYAEARSIMPLVHGLAASAAGALTGVLCTLYKRIMAPRARRLQALRTTLPLREHQRWLPRRPANGNQPLLSGVLHTHEAD